MITVSDELISAWLDREATREQAAEVEAAIKADPALGLRVAKLARLGRTLAPAYSETMSSEIPARLEALLAASEGTSRRGWSTKIGLAMPAWAAGVLNPAALGVACSALVAGVFAVSVLLQRAGDGSPGFIATNDGVLVANAVLAGDLRALASGGEAGVRIKLTIKDAAGRFCRQFEMNASAGLACLDGGAWRIEALSPAHPAPGARSGDYVMADGTPDPAIAVAMERVGLAGLLDREQEAAAIASKWK